MPWLINLTKPCAANDLTKSLEKSTLSLLLPRMNLPMSRVETVPAVMVAWLYCLGRKSRFYDERPKLKLYKSGAFSSLYNAGWSTLALKAYGEAPDGYL